MLRCKSSRTTNSILRSALLQMLSKRVFKISFCYRNQVFSRIAYKKVKSYLNKYRISYQQVFHTKSKFAALLDDEEPSEQDTQEQLDAEDET